MRILITHFFNKNNKGDAAILSVILRELRASFTGADLAVLTTRYAEVGETFEGVPLYNVLTYTRNGLFGRRLKALFVILLTTLWAALYKCSGKIIDIHGLLPKELKELAALYKNADVITPTGGGYITAKNTLEGNLHMVQQLHIIWLAQLLGKKVFMWPQSYGPFGNRFQRVLTRYVLSRVDVIFAREEISRAVLADISVDGPDIFVSQDMAFSFAPQTKEIMTEELRILGLNMSKPIVGVTVRQWFKGEAQQSYEKAISEFVQYVTVERNMQVIFIPQVTAIEFADDDRVVSKRIYNTLSSKGNAWDLQKNYTYAEVKGLYENLTFLVGTRMHSVIFALTGNVPSLAIEYEHKASGIMKSLGLESHVVSIGTITPEKLIEGFKRLEVNPITPEVALKLQKNVEHQLSDVMQKLKKLVTTKLLLQPILNLYYPHIGGIEINTHQLYQRLVRKEWEIHVFSHAKALEEEKSLPSRETIMGIQINRFSHWRFAYAPFTIGLVRRRTVIVMHDFLTGPDLLICLYTGVVKVLGVKKFALVFSSHGYINNRILYPVTMKDKLQNWIDIRIGLPLLDFVADSARTVSHHEESLLRAKGLRRIPIEVIGNGLEAEAWDANLDDKVSFEFKEKVRALGKYIVQVGRIDKLKNYELCINALQYLPHEIRLVIIAPLDGANKDYLDLLRSLIAKKLLSDRVTFYGPARGYEKYYLLRNAISFVHSSRTEGFGSVVIEAMSQGLIPFVTQGTALVELVENNVTGFHIDPDNSKELADKLLVILKPENLKTRVQISERNRLESKERSWDKITEKIDTMYREAYAKVLNK